MDKTTINNYFHSLFPIENEIVNKITETFTSFELSKNTCLLNQNTISTKTFFFRKRLYALLYS